MFRKTKAGEEYPRPPCSNLRPSLRGHDAGSDTLFELLHGELDGIAGLVEASPAGYREHGRFTIPQQSGSPTWSHPMIAGGLLILRDQDAVFAYHVKGT